MPQYRLRICRKPEVITPAALLRRDYIENVDRKQKILLGMSRLKYFRERRFSRTAYPIQNQNFSLLHVPCSHLSKRFFLFQVFCPKTFAQSIRQCSESQQNLRRYPKHLVEPDRRLLPERLPKPRPKALQRPSSMPYRSACRS